DQRGQDPRGSPDPAPRVEALSGSILHDRTGRSAAPALVGVSGEVWLAHPALPSPGSRSDPALPHPGPGRTRLLVRPLRRVGLRLSLLPSPGLSPVRPSGSHPLDRAPAGQTLAGAVLSGDLYRARRVAADHPQPSTGLLPP